MSPVTDLVVFLKGVTIGFIVAAPVGPIALLCMRRTLAIGHGFGIATGIGAAVADSICGTVAAIGLAAVSGYLVRHEVEFGMLGGIVMLGVAAQTWRARPKPPPHVNASGLFTAFITGLILTLSNPLTILGFAAVFAAFGLGSTFKPGSGAGPDLVAALVAGVFLGSSCWWLTLSAGISMLRAKVSPESLHRINMGVAVLLACFGAWALFSSFTGLMGWTEFETALPLP